ncbi:MAG: FecR domain-containing protein [bacterium]|nr:FecR domain-containing protein [bacterium]
MRKRIPRRHGHRYERQPNVLQPIIGIVIIIAILFFLGSWVLKLFGVGNAIARSAVTLIVEGGGSVQVSIEGSEFKKAEDDQKLFPGDTVTTGAGGNAQMQFFDGSFGRLDELSEITIEESFIGQTQSQISIRVTQGALWFSTPTAQSYSGSIIRSIETPVLKATVPSRSEGIVRSRSLIVFAADGIGVTVNHKDGVIPIIVGEGQQFTMPNEIQNGEDLYKYRSPLDPLALKSDFVATSRKVRRVTNIKEGSESTVAENTGNEALIVSSPDNDITVQKSVIVVEGSISKAVNRVRINGYTAEKNEEKGTFSLELALPEQDEVEIIIAALDEGGDLLSEVRRQIKRDREPPEAPTILSPAKNGDTYRTLRSRFTIEGTVAEGTTSVMVNDYRLQLFSPGDETWSYLASTNIDNLNPGRNTYNVYAFNEGGYKSDVASITILIEEGTEGLVETTDGKSNSSVEITTLSTSSSEMIILNNDPIQPGSLSIFAPTAGSKHTATGSSLLIEGHTSTATESVWVNGYRLRLYESGKDFWNYIADSQLGTLSRGQNLYEIIARDGDGRVLDKTRYTVIYRAGRS